MSDDAANRKKLNLAAGAAFALLALTAVGSIAQGLVPMDFSAYWAAANDFLNGSEPYASREFPFVYPPGALLLFAPLGALPQATAAIGWAILLWLLTAVAAVRWGQRLPTPISPGLAALGALMFFPVHRALDPLNVEIVLFALVTLCAPLTKTPSHLKEAVGGFGVGFVLAMKPHWLSVAGPMLFLQRRWSAIAGVIAGAIGMVVASLAQTGLWDAFIHKMKWEVGTHWTFDIWRLSPALGVLAFGLWCVAVLMLWRRKHPHAWLFALTPLVAWPRPAFYSYLLALPVVFYFASEAKDSGRRLAWLPAIIWSAPVGFLLVVLDVKDGEVVMELGHTWRSAAMSVVYWLTMLVMVLVLFRRFWLGTTDIAAPEEDE